MGKSPGIHKLFEQISRIASKDAPVLISGEQGTCKGLVAKLIHDNSLRQKGPFIVIDLASVPVDLADAALLGPERKAAAESIEQIPGRLDEAGGGTLFVEEIFMAGANLRDKMIRLIRDRGIKLNDHDGVPSDVRIIATTSRNLNEFVKKRHSLYDLFRVFNGGHLRIPPLRERKEDILPLVEYFMKESARKFDTGQKELSKDAKAYLLKYAWPGNVRELEHMTRRAMISSQGPLLERRDLIMADIDSCSIRDFLEEKLKRYLKEMMKLETCNLYHTVLSEAERSLVAIVLQETGGNQLKAANTLGINRNTLRSKIKEYKIRM
jgi:two-component system nitrogen regulation response regulator GlnG